MSMIHICDDCNKKTPSDKSIKFYFAYDHPLSKYEFCYDCFAKHWKPISKKFSLTGKPADQKTG